MAHASPNGPGTKEKEEETSKVHFFRYSQRMKSDVGHGHVHTCTPKINERDREAFANEVFLEKRDVGFFFHGCYISFFASFGQSFLPNGHAVVVFHTESKKNKRRVLVGVCGLENCS